jgi:ribosomal protein L18E
VPVDPDTGVIGNAYWDIVQNDPSADQANAVNITSALQWAVENGYNHVLLEQGVYYINGINNYLQSPSHNGIFVPSGISFDLNGSTLIQKANSSQAYSIISIIKENNVSVVNGTLIGDRQAHDYSGSGTHEFGFGIDIRGGSNITLSGLDISQMTGDAVLVCGADTYLSQGGSVPKDVTIADSSFSYCRRQGITVAGGEGISITNNVISNIKGTAPQCGIDLEAELDWPVTFSSIAAAAVEFHKNSIGNTLVNNTIDGFVSLTYGTDNVIEGNTIKNGGILITDTSEVYGTTMEGNILNNSYIKCVAITGTTIAGNTVKNGYINFSYSSGTVKNNIVSNSGSVIKYGIQIYADGQISTSTKYYVTLSENTVTGNYTKAIFVSSYSNLIVTTE